MVVDPRRARRDGSHLLPVLQFKGEGVATAFGAFGSHVAGHDDPDRRTLVFLVVRRLSSHVAREHRRCMDDSDDRAGHGAR